jgi:hypothetical protein
MIRECLSYLLLYSLSCGCCIVNIWTKACVKPIYCHNFCSKANARKFACHTLRELIIGVRAGGELQPPYSGIASFSGNLFPNYGKFWPETMEMYTYRHIVTTRVMEKIKSVVSLSCSNAVKLDICIIINMWICHTNMRRWMSKWIFYFHIVFHVQFHFLLNFIRQTRTSNYTYQKRNRIPRKCHLRLSRDLRFSKKISLSLSGWYRALCNVSGFDSR